MKKNAGTSLDMENDSEILSINSPQNRLKGPWFVVYKNVIKRWAIVVMHWEGNPCLGIRWFWRSQGTPSVRSYGTWLVVPDEISNTILTKLPISTSIREKTLDILKGKYTIEELQNQY